MGSGGRGRIGVRGHDGHTRGEEVDAAAVVGEVGALIVLIGGTDGDRARRGGRRGRARIVVAVTRRDNHDHAVIDDALDGCVDRSGVASTQAHVGDGELAGLVVRGDPVEAGDDIGGVAGATAVEDADGNDVDLGCDAVVGPTDRARHVRAVAVAVLAAIAVVLTLVDADEARADATVELLMVGAHARVDDVGGDAGAVRRSRSCCSGVHRAVERQVALVETVEAPRSCGG